MSDARFTCPCCGHRSLSGLPGSYEICKVCFWEDDGVQLLDPSYRGGANKPSLMECQANICRVGACEARFLGYVRPPDAPDTLYQEWRSAQESDLRWARTRSDLTEEEYNCLDTWYYWKRRAR